MKRYNKPSGVLAYTATCIAAILLAYVIVAWVDHSTDDNERIAARYSQGTR